MVFVCGDWCFVLRALRVVDLWRPLSVVRLGSPTPRWALGWSGVCCRPLLAVRCWPCQETRRRGTDWWNTPVRALGARGAKLLTREILSFLLLQLLGLAFALKLQVFLVLYDLGSSEEIIGQKSRYTKAQSCQTQNPFPLNFVFFFFFVFFFSKFNRSPVPNVSLRTSRAEWGLNVILGGACQGSWQEPNPTLNLTSIHTHYLHTSHLHFHAINIRGAYCLVCNL